VTHDSPLALDQRLRIDRAAAIIAAALAAMLAVLLARVALLQSLPSAALAAHLDDRLTTAPEPGIRGEILDRRGRVMASSRFGYRVFVDPTLFPIPADDAILALADAMGLPPDQVARRLLPRIAENERRAALRAAAPDDAPIDPALRPIRYVSVGGVLDDWRVDTVRALRIRGVRLELRGVRERPALDLAGPILGDVGVDHDGLSGAELMLESALRPSPGRLQYVRDALNRPLWVDPGGYVAPQRGRDVRLSIDLELQRIARDELERGVRDADAAGGRLVLLDPASGEILAIADVVRTPHDAVPFDWNRPFDTSHRYITIANPDRPRNRCVEDVYEPGSTFKPFLWAVTTALGLADPNEVVNTEGGVWVTPYGRRIADVVRKDSQTWAEVLVNSSNIGMAKVTRRLSDQQMRDAVISFGFGARTRIGLPGESPGIVTPQKAWSRYTQTSVAMGHEVAVTPVQMVHAFAAFARTGDLAGTLPPLRLVAVSPDAPQQPPARVLPPSIANLARQTMRGVAHNLDLRMARLDPDEPPPRYDLFAKSGTAEIPLLPPPPGRKRPRGLKGYFPNQYNSSFIAAGPSEDPRLVCVVVIDDPSPERVRSRRHYGAVVAGPVVRRVMERSLAYLGVPPSFASPEHPDDAAIAAAASERPATAALAQR
jgi:cell division protein FtsI/penicillin-binding protein 2